MHKLSHDAGPNEAPERSTIDEEQGQVGGGTGVGGSGRVGLGGDRGEGLGLGHHKEAGQVGVDAVDLLRTVCRQPLLGGIEAGSDEDGRRLAEPPGEVFKSPMLGTFYRAASPEAESFVKVGDRVTADKTLCIIEAMKMFNPIEADKSGTIVAILGENGQPVEFDQPLVVVE